MTPQNKVEDVRCSPNEIFRLGFCENRDGSPILEISDDESLRYYLEDSDDVLWDFDEKNVGNPDELLDIQKELFKDKHSDETPLFGKTPNIKDLSNDEKRQVMREYYSWDRNREELTNSWFFNDKWDWHEECLPNSIAWMLDEESPKYLTMNVFVESRRKDKLLKSDADSLISDLIEECTGDYEQKFTIDGYNDHLIRGRANYCRFYALKRNWNGWKDELIPRINNIIEESGYDPKDRDVWEDILKPIIENEIDSYVEKSDNEALTDNDFKWDMLQDIELELRGR